MKAPDVIYVEFSDEVNLAFEKQPFDETPAYIRKDALLEWAKDNYLNLRNRSIADRITASAFKEIIDKINSM